MRWLLDTNAWVDYLKHPSSGVRGQLMRRQPSEILARPATIPRAQVAETGPEEKSFFWNVGF
jgi:hypothetical protein